MYINGPTSGRRGAMESATGHAPVWCVGGGHFKREQEGYIYIYTYLYKYKCMYIYEYIHTYTYIYIHIYIYIYTYIYVYKRARLGAEGGDGERHGACGRLPCVELLVERRWHG